VITGLLLVACQPIQPVQPIDGPTSQIPSVLIKVDDDGFTIPANFPGGIIAVTVQNNSTNDLDVSFARLREGTSIAEVKTLYADLMNNMAQLLQMIGAMPSFNPVVAGASEKIIIDFRTGNFLVVANQHVEEEPPPGMQYIWGEFSANELVGTMEPQTDVKVEMDDFAYLLPNEIKAGNQWWEFANIGEQWHMLALVKLAPDATLDDLMGFMMTDGEPAGPPPFEDVPNGGIAPISEGERAWLELSLEPGTYVSVCPIPDMVAMMNGEGPLPHMMHGMVRQFTVK